MSSILNFSDFVQEVQESVESKAGTIQGKFILCRDAKLSYIPRNEKGIDKSSMAFVRNFETDMKLYFTGKEFTLETETIPRTTFREAITCENIKRGFDEGTQIYVIANPEIDVRKFLNSDDSDNSQKVSMAIDNNKKRAEALLAEDKNHIYFM